MNLYLDFVLKLTMSLVLACKKYHNSLKKQMPKFMPGSCTHLLDSLLPPRLLIPPGPLLTPNPTIHMLVVWTPFLWVKIRVSKVGAIPDAVLKGVGCDLESRLWLVDFPLIVFKLKLAESNVAGGIP